MPQVIRVRKYGIRKEAVEEKKTEKTANKLKRVF